MVAVYATIRRGPGCGRIVNHALEHLTPQWIGPDHATRYRRAEITVSIGVCRNCLISIVDSGSLPELLEADEEECLVPAYWTTDGKPVIMPPCPWSRIRAKVGERVARVERFIHQVFISGPVELIRARLHRDIEHTAAGLAIFGREIARLNRDFLDCVNARLALRRNARRA